jgi:hypothetical protein
MLDGIPENVARLTAPALCWLLPLPGSGLFGSRLGSASTHAGYGALFKFPGRASRRLFSAVNGVAEHFSHRCGPSQEVDLKAVSLFFCPRFGVNAPDVCF